MSLIISTFLSHPVNPNDALKWQCSSHWVNCTELWISCYDKLVLMMSVALDPDRASGSCSRPGRVLHVEPVSAEQRGSHLGGQLSSALYNEPGNELTVLRYRITLGMQDIRWIQYLHCNYVR